MDKRDFFFVFYIFLDKKKINPRKSVVKTVSQIAFQDKVCAKKGRGNG